MRWWEKAVDSLWMTAFIHVLLAVVKLGSGLGLGMEFVNDTEGNLCQVYLL
jgi:hypothetical protein